MRKRKVKSPTEEWYKVIEDRILIKKQNREFQETLEKDKIILEKLETEKRLRKEKEEFYSETKKLLELEDKDIFLKLKLNDKTTTFALSKNATVNTLINATKCFLFELDLFDTEFILIKDHPRLELSLSSEQTTLLKDLGIGKMALFHLKLK